MRKLAVAALLLSVLSLPASAQWQITDHASPVGRGNSPPKTGFKSFGPCADGVPHIGKGASVDPACAAETLSPLFSMGAGIVAKTGAGAYSARTLTAPAAGLTITNPAGTAGNPTFALADDLAALEALSTTGYARRTGTSTWDTRSASQILDDVGTTRGSVLFRGASGWSILAPGTATFVLTSNGAGADPSYAAAGSGTMTTQTAGTGINFSSGATCSTTCTVSTNLSTATNFLGANVATNNSTYTDGPSAAQGTSGTWFCSGTVTVTDTASPNFFLAKLYDGTTTIASTTTTVNGNNQDQSMTLSGILTSPAGNIRIAVKGQSNTGRMSFNDSSLSKDSGISCIRLN